MDPACNSLVSPRRSAAPSRDGTPQGPQLGKFLSSRADLPDVAQDIQDESPRPAKTTDMFTRTLTTGKGSLLADEPRNRSGSASNADEAAASILERWERDWQEEKKRRSQAGTQRTNPVNCSAGKDDNGPGSPLTHGLLAQGRKRLVQPADAVRDDASGDVGSPLPLNGGLDDPSSRPTASRRHRRMSYTPGFHRKSSYTPGPPELLLADLQTGLRVGAEINVASELSAMDDAPKPFTHPTEPKKERKKALPRRATVADLKNLVSHAGRSLLGDAPKPAPLDPARSPPSRQNSQPDSDAEGSKAGPGLGGRFMKIMSLQRQKTRAESGLRGAPLASLPDEEDELEAALGALKCQADAPTLADGNKSSLGDAAAAAERLQQQQQHDKQECKRPAGQPLEQHATEMQEQQQEQGAHQQHQQQQDQLEQQQEREQRGQQQQSHKASHKHGYIKSLLTLTPFVPHLLKVDMASNHKKYEAFDEAAPRELTAASKSLAPCIGEFQGSVMIADVKGFTQLTEILSKKGTAGVELLTNCMNNYFTRVIKMILAFDGDVIKFAGDSMIVAFYPNDEESQAADGGLHTCVVRATQCAHMLANRLGHMHMKSNGQVEPIYAQQPDRLAEHEDGAVEDALHGGLMTSASVRRRHIESPRSSTNNTPGRAFLGNGMIGDDSSMSQHTGGQPSPSAHADTSPGASDVRNGAAGGTNSFTTRKKSSKSWISNVMSRKPGGRRSEAMDGATTSSGHVSGSNMSGSQRSFELSARSNHSNHSNHQAHASQPHTARGGKSRPRAKTELSGRANEATSLWGDTAGFGKRELSIASKLAMPPPVRANLATRMGTSAHQSAALLTSSPTRMPASYDGGHRTSMSGSIHEAISPGRHSNNNTVVPAESWQSRFQSLTASVTGDIGDMQPERSRLSLSSRTWANNSFFNHHTVANTTGELLEEEPMLGVSGFDDHVTSDNGSATLLTASNAARCAPRYSGGTRTSRHMPARRVFSHSILQVPTIAAAAAAAATAAKADAHKRSMQHSKDGNVVATGNNSPFEWSGDSHSVEAVNSFTAHTNKGMAGIGDIIGPAAAAAVRGAGPVAEGSRPSSSSAKANGSVKQALAGEASANDLNPRTGSTNTTSGSFMSKVVSWFQSSGSRTARAGGQYPDSFTHVKHANDSNSSGDGGSRQLSISTHSNSFNRVPSSTNHVGSRFQPTVNHPNHPNNRHGRDPVMEEVQNSTFSLKLMVSAGSVCVFHVGGNIDEVSDPTMPEVPRWEFFIGDRPLAPSLDQHKRRWCIAQLAAIEKHSEAGEVVVSQEVLNLVGEDWEVEMVSEDVGRILLPRHAFHVPSNPLKLNHLLGLRQPSHASSSAAATADSAAARASSNSLAETDSVAAGAATGDAAAGAAGGAANPAGIDVSSHRVSFTALSAAADACAASVSAASVGSVPHGAVSIHMPTSPLAVAAPPLVAADSQKMQELVDTSERPSNNEQDDADSDVGTGIRHEFSNEPEYVQHRIAGLLRMHVLGSVRSRIEAGHLDFINEIRPLTCIFLGFPSLLDERDTATHSDQVFCVQFAVQQVQDVMRKWDGSFMQFRCDEKGFVAICAFGLPGHTHEDNPSRGILAAVELRQRIKDGNHRICVGVTTGDLLCTCVGARKLRSEYTVFGDAINLSARLMVKCRNGLGDILCDEPTYLYAKYKAKYEELEPFPVKGKQLPVVVFRVTPFEGNDQQNSQTLAMVASNEDMLNAPERPLIGRDAEMTLILNQAANMISGMSTGGAIVLEGNTGMGKTKLLCQVRKSLERINADTSALSGKPAFHLFSSMADIANKSQKLHPWRRVFQEIFLTDLNRGFKASVAPAAAKQRRRSVVIPDTSSGLAGAMTLLGDSLANRISGYNSNWRNHLSELLDLPLPSIPRGTKAVAGASAAEDEMLSAGSNTVPPPLGGTSLLMDNGMGSDTPVSSIGISPLARAAGGSIVLTGSTSPKTLLTPVPMMAEGSGPVGFPQRGMPERAQTLRIGSPPTSPNGAMPWLGESDTALPPPSMPAGPAPTSSSELPVVPYTTGGMPAPPRSKSQSLGHNSNGTLPMLPPLVHAGGSDGGSIIANLNASITHHGSNGMGHEASVRPTTMHQHSSTMAGPGLGAALKKNSLNVLVHVIGEFIELYGPVILLLENLHEFDTWSWQLLVKVAEVLSSNCLILATTRPNEPPAAGSSHHLHGKAALYQKVAMMYRHLLKLPTTHRMHLEPFNFHQTKALMQVVADINYPDQYVLAVMEKTGGMPLYIEKVTEFLCQKPWLADSGGEFAANVNKMIRNLNFQQVIIERMDRLKPGIHLTLKVASVMGQWVDLDILHKFYPINKSREELRGHLMELERGNFLKPTDTEGVWEFNMVERDIVYEVIPHYQRRRLHAKLAQELERSLEEHHVATLTTIAYHWNQACMGHEVTEVECALKSIEFWHRAAESAYSVSSLMEALRLYQKAAQIAEILGESIGESAHVQRQALQEGSLEGVAGEEGHNHSFTAVGSTFRGALNWSLIGRINRAQWEKSMASCCLGIVLQHRYEFNNQMEYWDTEDYFMLLTEHAIRGLMLLGAPHPKELLAASDTRRPWLLACALGCCFDAGAEQPHMHAGMVLQEQEVAEIRDILLVLIIAAEHYSLQHDGEEYTRLLAFCKRVCGFFQHCPEAGTDAFDDIQTACSDRIKKFKSSRGNAGADFVLFGPVPSVLDATSSLDASQYVARPQLSRAILANRRFEHGHVQLMP